MTRTIVPAKAALLGLLVLPAGCISSFGDSHFFKTVDSNGQAVNYFRMQVTGKTFLSSSRYVSGWFDDKAVEAYFSELKQPDNARFSETVADTGGKDTQPVDASLAGRSLVLLLSSNSDDIATQIGALVEGKEVQAALVRLVNRDTIREARSASLALEQETARAKTIARVAQTIVDTLPADADKATTEAKLLELTNLLASALGSERPFTDLPEGQAWLEQNRTRLLGRSQ